MAKKTGANQPCPCDSGLKYKRCCGRPDQPPPVKKRTYAILGCLMAVAVVGIVGASVVKMTLLPDEAPTPLLSTPLPALPVAASTGVPGPQPDGPVPPGKMWSTEHGHWHDAPFTTGATQVPLTQTPASGEPAPGQVWSEEHQHWH